jgi:outer membrane lipoprotein-sorting protein
MIILLSGAGSAQNAELSASEIYAKAQLALYYQGDDMKASLTMKLVSDGGGVQTRELTMLRIDESDGGDQKYFIYFHEPGDVRRMTFMVHKYAETEDDRWIFVPAVDLVRRISADDKYSSFVGSDFTYEDVSGRNVEEDTHTLLRTETYNGSECHVIQSIPKGSAPYTKQISWIDSTDFIPLKEEYYDAQNELYRMFSADSIQKVTSDGMSYPTVMVRTMDNVKTGHSTVVTYSSVSYDIDLNSDDFSERYMRNPPREWID